MSGTAEHVAGRDFTRDIAVYGEVFQIARQSRRVAGNIDNAFRIHLTDGSYQLLPAALSRRVKNHYIGRQALLPKLLRRRRRVCADESRIPNAVSLSIFLCVFNSVGDDLHADKALAVARHGQSDRARTAIEI